MAFSSHVNMPERAISISRARADDCLEGERDEYLSNKAEPNAKIGFRFHKNVAVMPDVGSNRCDGLEVERPERNLRVTEENRP
jgi:hypothetical protein